MKRGPKPKQTKLRELEGAFRSGKAKKPTNELPVTEGRPPASILVKSDDLSLAIFNETCDILESMGVLAEQDAFMIEAFALNYRELALCYKNVQKDGIEAESQRGDGRSSVHVTNLHKFQATHIKLLGELGLTPSARLRMIPPERSGDGGSPVDALLKKLGGK